MKVLLVTGSYPPLRCGIGDYTFHLASALALYTDCEVGVLTSSGAKSNNDRISIFPIMDRWRLFELLKAIRVIRSWSANVVHIQYPTQGYGNGILPWILPLFAFLMGKKVVQTWHEIYGEDNVPKLFMAKAIVPGGLVFVRPNYKDKLCPSLRWTLKNKKLAFIKNASSIPKSTMTEQERDALRASFLRKQERLIVFFGFVYPHKGIEHVFEVADPAIDQIVIAGEIADIELKGKIENLINNSSWSGHVTITGFLPEKDVSNLLSIADAVVLPFRNGGGEWNTSIHSAILQGTFVITTSSVRNGYDENSNVYYAKIDDVQEMKGALNSFSGSRRKYNAEIDDINEWQEIALDHYALYAGLWPNKSV